MAPKAGNLRHGWISLLAYPILFVLLTFVLVYITVMPILRPYANVPGLFVKNVSEAVSPRDLLSDASSNTPAPGEVSTEPPEDTPAVEMIPVSSIVKPNTGDKYGRLTVEGTKVDAPIYWGDTSKLLNKGIGTYTGGWLPGYGRTIMMAGHRDSYLKDLGKAEIGGIITVETHYETYTYTIVDIQIFHMDDSSGYDFSRKDENLILYTCYPFDYVGHAKQRYFVYAEPLTGRPVDRQS